MRTLGTDFTDSDLRYYARIVYDGGELDSGSIKELKVTQTAVGSSSGITLGGTPAATLTATIVNGVDLKNKSVQVYISRGESAEISLGVFIINDSQAGEEFTEITGYDAMYSTLEWAYYPSNGVSTAKAVLADVCDQAGLELVLPDGLSDVSGLSVATGYTYREMLGYMAALLGCNSRINDDGAVQLSWFEDSGLKLGPSSIYTGGLTVDTANWTLGLLTCSVTTSTTTESEDGTTSTESATETLTSGSGNLGISFENPWMTQTILDEVYDKIGGLSYRGGTVSAIGDLRIEPGDIITVTDKSGTSYDMPVMSVTHSYDGGLKTEISAYADSETESSGSVTGPVTKAMERVTAQMAVYEQLQAQNLRAVNAIIENLTATVATINEAYITTATVETLLADYATVETLNAATATITTLLADYATVENLSAATATITTLSSSMAEITALLSGTIGTGTLQAIHLTSENVVIDDAVITSAMIASITADKITSGTIYTSQVTIQTAEDDTSLKIADGTIQISDGTYVRVQIGEDASGDYNLYLWNADGDLIWNAQGLTAEGLGGNGAIIKDLNVADDAAISGSKLDIKSVASALNNDGSLVVDAANVTINDTTLSAAYTSIITRFDGYDSSLSELESESVANIVTYYAVGASATESPGDPAETDVWTTEQLTAGEDEYLWVCYKQEMVDGSENWTTPFCITDSYARTKTATLQTSLEVVQGQISSLVSKTTFTETIDALTGEITTLQDQYTFVTEKIDGITTEIGDITTIVGDNYEALNARITTISERADGITTTVRALSTTVDTVDSNYTTLSSQVSELEMTVSSISLSVTSSSSGTASIVLSVDGENTGDAVEAVTSARTAFAAEDTACTISAGTVTFNSNTFVVNSTYFGVTAAGVITATSGTIGAITLSSTGIYSGGTYTYTGEDDPGNIRSTKYVGWYRPTDMDDGDDTISFYAGASSTNATNIASAPFRVTYGGSVVATDFKTGGSFEVYSSSSLTTLGGYMGYLTGSTGSEETIGVGVIDATSTNYLIATDAGVRMSSDTADLYVSGSRVVATGDMTCKDGLTVTGATILKSTLTVTDAVTLSSTVEVTDYAMFRGEVYFEDSVTVDTLAVTDKISLGETLEGYECYIEGAAGSSAFLDAHLGYVHIQNYLYFGRGSTYGSINYLGQASLRRLTMTNASDGIRLTTNACIYSGIVSDSNFYPLFYTDSSYDYLHIGYPSGITAMFLKCGGNIYLNSSERDVVIGSDDISSDWTAGNSFNLCFPTSSTTYGAYVYANSSGFNLGRSAFPTTIRSSGPTVTLTGNSSAQYLSVTYTDSACNAQVRVYSADDSGCLYANAGGGFGLYNFKLGKPLIYQNSAGLTYVGASGYVTSIEGSSVSVTGTLEVQTTDIYCGLATSTQEQRIQVRNSYARGYLYANTSGNLGIYNSTLAVNMIYQSSSGKLELGTSTYATRILGSTISSNVSISTSSDRSLKTNIESLPDSYEAILDAMEPVQFSMIADESGKLHMGYIANDVLTAAENAGLAESDIAWVVRGDDDLLGLSYSEIIPLLHLKIKKLEARIAQLESA